MQSNDAIRTELKELAPGLLEAGRTLPYQVEEGYFSTLQEQVMRSIETEELAPLLNSIDKTPAYELPEHYFEEFRISAGAKDKEQSKVFRFAVARKWISYAAAAVLTGILVTGTILYSDNQTEREIEKYQHVDFSAAIDEVPDTELNNYIENSHSSLVELISETENVDLPEMDEKMQHISQEYFFEYLTNNRYLEPVTAQVATK